MKLDVRLESVARRACRQPRRREVRERLALELAEFIETWNRLGDRTACFSLLMNFCAVLEAAYIWGLSESLDALGRKVLFDEYEGRNPAPLSSKVLIESAESGGR